MSLLHSITVALHFAWGDTKARYRRSVLGPFWIVLSTAVGVVGLGFLWSSLLHTDKATFIPSLTVGLIVWQLLNSTITEGPQVFLRYSSLIRNISVPLILFPILSLAKNIIIFLHNCLVIVAVMLIFHLPLSPVQLLVIPGFLLLAANLLWISLFVGMLGARFRDLELLIGAIMPMMFFLSPVIFRPDHLVSQALIWFNPFSYFITIIRDPLQGVVPPPFVYGVTFAMLVAGWTAATMLYKMRRTRLAFWI